MKTIDLTSAMNPAQLSALKHAQERANREGKAFNVYVAGPDAKQTLKSSGFNVWYVRGLDEQMPEDAQLYRTITPQR